MSLNLIVAYNNLRGIGYNNTIPWYDKGDLKRFREITLNSNIIMGRNTWLSLGQKPLPKRNNYIISSTLPKSQNVFRCLDDCLNHIKNSNKNCNPNQDTFIIGGNRLYQEVISRELCDNLYITEIDNKFECDVFFPELHFKKYRYMINRDGRYITYSRIQNKEEEQYLNLLREVIDTGTRRGDRTGTGTLSLFGKQMRFDLSQGFPLLTTKKMFLRGIIEELLWFLRGHTDAKILTRKKVGIWDGNSSREYLDSLGLVDREVGDCGPIYGFNFRHFGGEYKDCHTDYRGVGTDQLRDLITGIKTNPNSRRLIINLWNPNDLDKVVLPACHTLYQFYVSNGKLSCSLYQRSGDLGLGVPFNIASASLLTMIISNVCNLELGELVHTIGDAHIYINHIDALEEQITRRPYRNIVH